MKKYILLLLELLLAGCQATPAHPSLFENPVCEPPCWEKITPGGSTKGEALAILSKITAIDQPVVDRNSADIGYDDEIQFTAYKAQDNHVEERYLSSTTWFP